MDIFFLIPSHFNGLIPSFHQPSGTLLAGASFDGNVYLWSPDGELKRQWTFHTAPITAIKWSKRGDVLATASLDKHVVIWDPNAAEMKQKFDHAGLWL